MQMGVLTHRHDIDCQENSWGLVLVALILWISLEQAAGQSGYSEACHQLSASSVSWGKSQAVLCLRRGGERLSVTSKQNFCRNGEEEERCLELLDPFPVDLDPNWSYFFFPSCLEFPLFPSPSSLPSPQVRGNRQPHSRRFLQASLELQRRKKYLSWQENVGSISYCQCQVLRKRQTMRQISTNQRLKMCLWIVLMAS